MIRLYPPQPIVGQDFRNEKVITVPNQNMTLRDILKRFIRKESLPVAQEGIYIDTLGDLEKLARQDITIRMDRADQLKEYIYRAEKRMEELDNARKGDGVESPSSVAPPPKTGVPSTAHPTTHTDTPPSKGPTGGT